MIYANKHLQKSDLLKQIKNKQQEYYQLSLNKEYKQQSFLNNMSIVNSSGEFLNMYHSFEKSYKKYTKSLEQKVYAIEHIAKDRNLVPIFITLTLPTEYHPFISIKYKGKSLYVKENINFEFETVNQAIIEGYQFLNRIYRTFYKRIKHEAKELMYIKVIEAHKTFIPHCHVLLFVKKENLKIISEIFAKIVNEFQLAQYDIDLVEDKQNIKTDIGRASKYLMKYVTKSLNSNDDYFKARVLDGWKKSNKIRMISMSNLPLSLEEYRSIYHNLDNEIKEDLLSKSKEQNINLFTYILFNMLKRKVILEDNAIADINQFGNENNNLELFISKQRSKVDDTYRYKTLDLQFFIDQKMVYEKEKFIQIKN